MDDWMLIGVIGVVTLILARKTAVAASESVTPTSDGTIDPTGLLPSSDLAPGYVAPIMALPGLGAADPVAVFAQAISVAEGFNVPGSAPNRANNPGALKLLGYPTTGAENISVFPTADDGWQALDTQLRLIRNGQSHVYSLDDTIGTMAQKWTDTDGSAWANNVALTLGVSVDTPIGAVLA